MMIVGRTASCVGVSAKGTSRSEVAHRALQPAAEQRQSLDIGSMGLVRLPKKAQAPRITRSLRGSLLTRGRWN